MAREALASGSQISCAAFYSANIQLNPSRALNQKVGQQIAANAFITDRGIRSYSRMLGQSIGLDFVLDLLSLDRKKVWLDAGSGEGAAIDSYFTSSTGTGPRPTQRILEILEDLSNKPITNKATALGITFKMEPSTIAGRIPYESPTPVDSMMASIARTKTRFITNRYFENIPDVEIGKVDLTTDIFGIFSYSIDPELILRRYLDLMNVGGTLYVHTDSVYIRASDNVSGGIPFSLWLNFQNWPGLAIKHDGRSFSIRKLSEQYQIPNTKT